MTDKEMLEQVLARLGSIDQKLKIAKSRVSDEHLNSAYTDVAGLIIMLRSHLQSAKPPAAE